MDINTAHSFPTHKGEWGGSPAHTKFFTVFCSRLLGAHMAGQAGAQAQTLTQLWLVKVGCTAGCPFQLTGQDLSPSRVTPLFLLSLLPHVLAHRHIPSHIFLTQFA